MGTEYHANDKEVASCWDDNAEVWAKHVRAGYDTYRELYNNPAFFEFVGDLSNLTVLDAGCGEGHNTRKLAEQGARVVGVDISTKMIELARAEEQRKPLGIRYEVASISNLTIFTEHQTEQIEGQDFANGMLIKDLKSGVQKRLGVTGVFIEIGLVPNSEPVKELIELNNRGEVPINCSCETVIPGLYAAGDVTDVPEKQLVVAAGEGAKAALQAHRYLQRLAR